MELNREQAIDILDKFNFFQGQRAGRELWNDKPFDEQEQDISNFSRDVALLKNYINELTAENERLRLTVGAYYVKTTLLSNDNERMVILLDKKCDECIAREKADTVRKMQDMVAVHFGTYTTEDVVKVGDVFKLLDKIEQKMLEEAK